MSVLTRKRVAHSLCCLSVLLILLTSARAFSDLQVEGTNSFSSLERDGEVLRVVEHRVTAAELDRLKQKIGVREEHVDYNRVLNGRGTGLAPPTEDKWGKISMNMYVVDEIRFNGSSESQSSVDQSAEPENRMRLQ